MNTKNALEIAKVSSLLAFSFLCATLGINALRLGTTVKKVNENLDELHATLVVTHRVANNARVTIDNINKAALDERFYFEKEMPTILGKVNTVLGDTHNLLTSASSATQSLTSSQAQITEQATKVLETANDTVSHLDLVLGQANNNLAQMEIAEKHLDALIQSPDITGTVHNVYDITGSGARTMADIEGEVHNITHPRPVVSVINWTLKVGHAVGAWIHP